MGEQTAIAWTDHTFNPWMGCTKVSPGCDNCYAEALGKRTGRVQWGDTAARVVTSDGYWRNPAKWNAAAVDTPGVRGDIGRHLVFCASLADVFEARGDVIDARRRLFDLVEATPNLDWQLLTKRPENVLALVPPAWHLDGFPPNVWIGTTVEDQQRADQRIPLLLEIPAAVRFLSCEPLLEEIEIYGALHDGSGSPCSMDDAPLPHVNWVICGGESGPGHRPLDPDWARSLRDQCDAADVEAHV